MSEYLPHYDHTPCDTKSLHFVNIQSVAELVSQNLIFNFGITNLKIKI
jgi:hypothetical protein